jgi:hypothetical protein
MKDEMPPPPVRRLQREGATQARSYMARATKKVGRANEMLAERANHIALTVEGGVDRHGWGEVDSQPMRPHHTDSD